MKSKKRSCYWIIIWLDIYLALLFLLTSCYLLLLSNQNQSGYLFLFHIPIWNDNIIYDKLYDKQRKNISQWWIVCVLHNVMLWNISFSGWRFRAFYGLYRKMFFCRQPWWQPLVNTCLVFQYRENVKSFNFLANALTFPWWFASMKKSLDIDWFFSVLFMIKYSAIWLVDGILGHIWRTRLSQTCGFCRVIRNIAIHHF